MKLRGPKKIKPSQKKKKMLKLGGPKKKSIAKKKKKLRGPKKNKNQSQKKKIIIIIKKILKNKIKFRELKALTNPFLAPRGWWRSCPQARCSCWPKCCRSCRRAPCGLRPAPGASGPPAPGGCRCPLWVQKSTFVREKKNQGTNENHLKGRPHGRTRGYFTSYFCTCTTFLASYTYKSTCVCVRVRRPPTMLDFCTSYTCTTYKCTSLLYSDELLIIADVSNQMVFLQDIHYKLFYILIFSSKHVKKAK